MKNLFLALLLSSATLVSAQTTKQVNSDGPQDRATRFESADDIAKSLEISQADAQLVWSKLSEYQRAKDGMREKTRDQMQDLRKTGEQKTDAEYESAYRARLNAQREKINLDENYYNQFLELLPASKVHTLLKSERRNQREMREQGAKPEQQRTRIRR